MLSVDFVLLPGRERHMGKAFANWLNLRIAPGIKAKRCKVRQYVVCFCFRIEDVQYNETEAAFYGLFATVQWVNVANQLINVIINTNRRISNQEHLENSFTSPAGVIFPSPMSVNFQHIPLLLSIRPTDAKKFYSKLTRTYIITLLPLPPTGPHLTVAARP